MYKGIYTQKFLTEAVKLTEVGKSRGLLTELKQNLPMCGQCHWK